ncbi:MAG: hypothetical protein IPK60_18800 [Sandaracinaceae bacterium]|nr:hypothetical protein [Sandaracinaceae bacterium]
MRIQHNLFVAAFLVSACGGSQSPPSNVPAAPAAQGVAVDQSPSDSAEPESAATCFDPDFMAVTQRTPPPAPAVPLERTPTLFDPAIQSARPLSADERVREDEHLRVLQSATATSEARAAAQYGMAGTYADARQFAIAIPFLMQALRSQALQDADEAVSLLLQLIAARAQQDEAVRADCDAQLSAASQELHEALGCMMRRMPSEACDELSCVVARARGGRDSQLAVPPECRSARP